MNQSWLLIDEILWHSFKSNLTATDQATILYNEFESYSFNIAATSFLSHANKNYDFIRIKKYQEEKSSCSSYNFLQPYDVLQKYPCHRVW